MLFLWSSQCTIWSLICKIWMCYRSRGMLRFLPGFGKVQLRRKFVVLFGNCYTIEFQLETIWLLRQVWIVFALYVVWKVKQGDHLFLYCTVAKQVWFDIFTWLKVPFGLPHSRFSIFNCLLYAGDPKAGKGRLMIYCAVL
jgi:hypothetical protein